MAKPPTWLIKNAGNIFTENKKSVAPPETGTVSSPAYPPQDLPFVGLYDATVEIVYAGPEWAESKFATGTTNQSKVQLDCNGHPLVLPLDRMHPGFCGRVSLMPEQQAVTWQSSLVDVSVADNTGCQDMVSDWAGTYVSDGSALRLGFRIRPHNYHPFPNKPPDTLTGFVQCVRTHAG